MALKIWSEKVSLPTYGIGPQEKNPMFFEKRVYQGSSGKVYPYPVIDKIEDEKTNQEYEIVFLENDYLQVQIMPELGGRIYRSIDKTNNYDFVYHNQVIKPALIGLLGPWISGGIEFNWPQHHRPNTFGPVEYWLDDSQSDSKTVYLSEIDRMYGTKVTTAITLREAVSRIEITSEVYNPTGEYQSFLWWANPAVEVHEETQSIFPPDVHAVMDHGKRDVSRFPIATGVYYKHDYSPGTDISRYKNIPVPTSYMAYHSDYDFVGGYDYRENAGILHIADHHISPGKKQWTWGNGDFGRAWDRNLTDEDGPYIELMTGVYTDNQPDFSWLAPYSSKRFTQFFMPYKEVGSVKNASKDFVLGFEHSDEQVDLIVYASSETDDARIVVSRADEVILNEQFAITPSQVFRSSIPFEAPLSAYKIEVNADGLDGIKFAFNDTEMSDIPEPAKAIGSPETLKNTEALYLAGLHLEQYRHATYEPDAYYLEGLKRDPDDIRINNAYGNLLLKRGSFSEAVSHFEIAMKTATRHNPNPLDSEVFYNLGKAYEHLGRVEDAYSAYYKATWSDSLRGQGYLKLAQIALRRGNSTDGRMFALESLFVGYKNLLTRSVLALCEKATGHEDEYKRICEETLQIDPLDFFARRALEPESYARYLRDDPHNFLYLSEIYASCGAYEDAINVLNDYLNSVENPYAMVLYLRALYQDQVNDEIESWKEASSASSDYVFPNRLYEYKALLRAIEIYPEDAKAHYYLGCFLYDKRRHDDACSYWEESIRLDSNFPTAYRNLSFYYANKREDYVKAKNYMEKAFSLNSSDPRILFELMDLYRIVGMDPVEQKKVLEDNISLVHERDDLVIVYCEVLNALGEHEKALEILLNRKFHPWEGGEGKVPTQHILARMQLARESIAENDPESAIKHLEAAKIYYHNFGEGKLAGAQENQINYTLGLAYSLLENNEKATHYYQLASDGLSEPVSAMYYNDQPPHLIFYQGLAFRALGDEDSAKERFRTLIEFGEKHVDKIQHMDYFAVSMPDFLVFERNLNEQNQAHCHYMMGLGYLGLDKEEKAKYHFQTALKIIPNHYGVKEHLAMI